MLLNIFGIIIIIALAYFGFKYYMSLMPPLEMVSKMTKDDLLNLAKSYKFNTIDVKNVNYKNSIKSIDILSETLIPCEYELWQRLNSKIIKQGNSKVLYEKKFKYNVIPQFSKNTYQSSFEKYDKFDMNDLSFEIEIPEVKKKMNTDFISLTEFDESMRDGQTKIDLFGISKNMLSDLSEISRNQILRNFNNLLSGQKNFTHNIGKGSLTYKEAKKGPKDEISSFRQIIAIPSIVSQFHRILSLRLSNYLDSNSYIDTTIQKCGVSGNKNPLLEQIVKVKNIIKNANNNKKTMNLLFVDISDAYPSLNIYKLCVILKKYGVDDNFINYIKNFYKDFKYYTGTRHWNSDNLVWERGLLQGCPLSPILFVTVLNYVFKHLEKKFGDHYYSIAENKKVLFIAYMDDIVIVTNNNYQMKTVYFELEKLLKEFGLKINKSKTSYMEFNQKNEDGLLDLNFGIGQVNKFKYLGEEICDNGSSLNSLRTLALLIKNKMIYLDKSKKMEIDDKVRYITSTLIPLIQRKMLVLYDVPKEEKIKILHIIKLFLQKWQVNYEIELLVDVNIKNVFKDTNDEFLKDMVYENVVYQNEDPFYETKIKLSELQIEYETLEKDGKKLESNEDLIEIVNENVKEELKEELKEIEKGVIKQENNIENNKDTSIMDEINKLLL